MPEESSIGRRRRAAIERGSPEVAERREQIAKAAAELFAERGLERTTFADISERAGLNRSLMYYYYRSKEDIFQDIVLEIIEANLTRLRRIARSRATPTQKMFRAVIDIMESYDMNYPHMYLYVRTDMEQLKDADSDKTQRILRTSTSYVREMVDIVRAGQRTGEFQKDATPEILVYGILGIVNWTHQWYKPDGRYSATQLGEIYARLALGGIARPHAHETIDHDEEQRGGMR